MPRNIEYLTEKYIEENNFELFILTFAIQSGIKVPQKMLERFGTSYGVDEFFRSMESLEKEKRELTRIKKHLLGTEFIDKVEIKSKINKEYELKLYRYDRHNQWYQERMNNLTLMKNRVAQLTSFTNLQAHFKNKILKYFDSEIKKLEKQFLKEPKPTKATIIEFINKNYSDLKKSVKRLKQELLIDPVFCKSLEKDWLKRNIHQKINSKKQKE